MIALLTKLGLSGAATFVASKGRLIIEYALIAIVVTLCGVASALWVQKQRTAYTLAKTETRLVGAEGRITAVEGVNQAHEATIQDLKKLRGQDAKAIDGLITDYKGLSKSDEAARSRLQNLEKSNATVRTYLNQRVPAELTCLLNNTCAPADKDSHQDRAPAAPAKPH